jgi:hypothetical protein
MTMSPESATIGVKFTRAMRPYGAGDPALLPRAVGERMIEEGHAVAHAFPDKPHANGPLPDRDEPAPAARVAPKKTPIEIAADIAGRQKYAAKVVRESATKT